MTVRYSTKKDAWQMHRSEVRIRIEFLRKTHPYPKTWAALFLKEKKANPMSRQINEGRMEKAKAKVKIKNHTREW